MTVKVDSIENGKISLSLLEDLEISDEQAAPKGNGNSRNKKNFKNDRRDNKPKNQNRKRVSFEDDFEKGF